MRQVSHGGGGAGGVMIEKECCAQCAQVENEVYCRRQEEMAGWHVSYMHLYLY